MQSPHSVRRAKAAVPSQSTGAGTRATGWAEQFVLGENNMREAVVVSYARTGLAKSMRGGFNITPPMTMAAHAIHHAVERAGVDKEYVEDCYLGNCAHGSRNIGREAALLAGMPKTTAGVSVNRFCS